MTGAARCRTEPTTQALLVSKRTSGGRRHRDHRGGLQEAYAIYAGKGGVVDAAPDHRSRLPITVPPHNGPRVKTTLSREGTATAAS